MPEFFSSQRPLSLDANVQAEIAPKWSDTRILFPITGFVAAVIVGFFAGRILAEKSWLSLDYISAFFSFALFVSIVIFLAMRDRESYKTARNLFSRAFDTSPNCYLILDPNRNPIYANPSLRHLLMGDIETTQGHIFAEKIKDMLTKSDDLGRVITRAAAGYADEAQLPITLPDGRVRMAAISAHPVRRRRAGWVLCCLKLIESLAATSHQNTANQSTPVAMSSVTTANNMTALPMDYYRSFANLMLAHVTEPMLVLNPKAEIMVSNQAFRQFVGREVIDLNGKPLYQFVLPEDHIMLGEYLALIFGHVLSPDGELIKAMDCPVRFLGAGGTVFDAEVALAKIEDSRGITAGALLRFRRGSSGLADL